MKHYVARWRERVCHQSKPEILLRDLERYPHISTHKIKENNGLFSEVSVCTVSQCVHELGSTSHCPIKKPVLTSVLKGCRVAYALKYIQWDEADWFDVLWSNKAILTVTEQRGDNMYQERGSDPLYVCELCGTMKHHSSLKVWDFSGRGLKRFVVLPANIKFN